MNISRAIEIFNSKGVIKVCYQDSPVWLEKIGEYKVQVQDLSTNEHFEVSVYDLNEG